MTLDLPKPASDAVDVARVHPDRVYVRCRHCGHAWHDKPEYQKQVALHAAELTLEMVPEEVRAKFKGKFRKARKQTESFQEQIAGMFHRVLLKPGQEPQPEPDASNAPATP